MRQQGLVGGATSDNKTHVQADAHSGVLAVLRFVYVPGRRVSNGCFLLCDGLH